MKLMVDRPYHNAEMRSAGREAQAEKRKRSSAGKEESIR